MDQNNIQALIHSLIHNSFFLHYGLIGVFFNGMFSSILPIPTELTVSALIAGGDSKIMIAVVLITGSVLGGIMAYYIGSKGNTLFQRLHKKPKQEHADHAHKMLSKYGWVVIFICSWIPILGDVIPITAGIKKYDFRKFLIAMVSGKVLKVIAIIFVICTVLK